MDIGDKVKVINAIGDAGSIESEILDKKIDFGHLVYLLQTPQGKLWIMADRVRKI